MRRGAFLVFAVLPAIAGACGDKPRPPAPDAGASAPSGSASASAPSSASASAAVSSPPPPPPPPPPLRCPRDMVAIDDRFCIDRWEASLVDKRTGLKLSPYYPPDRRESVRIADHWENERLRVGDERAREIPLPPLPAFQRDRQPDPMAVSKRGVTPSGYLSKPVAKRACENASKRLCLYEEWKTACMGEAKRPYPYGEKYVQGACNVFRALHPAAVLHDNPAVGHLDPRLNLVRDKEDPLLRKTGATPRCKSEWGEDAVYDMNGNLDEWVEDEKPRYVGGFFSRSKRDGCDSSVGSHPETYFDYSTGVRCCSTPER